jgi:hypothetical protein
MKPTISRKAGFADSAHLPVSRRSAPALLTSTLACLSVWSAMAFQVKEYDPASKSWKEMPSAYRTLGDSSGFLWLYKFDRGDSKAIAAVEFKGSIEFFSFGVVSINPPPLMSPTGEKSLITLLKFNPPDYDPHTGQRQKITKSDLVEGRVVIATDTGETFTIYGLSGNFSGTIEPGRVIPGAPPCPSLVDAAAKGDIAATTSLLAAGADPNCVTDSNIKGWTPLMAAAKAGSTEVTNALLKAGANVNAKNGYGATPLDIATVHGYSSEIAVAIFGAGGKGRDKYQISTSSRSADVAAAASAKMPLQTQYPPAQVGALITPPPSRQPEQGVPPAGTRAQSPAKAASLSEEKYERLDSDELYLQFVPAISSLQQEGRGLDVPGFNVVSVDGSVKKLAVGNTDIELATDRLGADQGFLTVATKRYGTIRFELFGNGLRVWLKPSQKKALLLLLK